MPNYGIIMESLKKVEEQVNKDREEIWKLTEFISSLRSVLSYIKNGNPFPGEVI